MEKQFQFTSKWSNIDSGLKAGPGGSQTQEAGLRFPLIEIQIMAFLCVCILPN